MPSSNQHEQVIGSVEDRGLLLQSDPGGDVALAVSVIELWSEEHSLHSALFVVVRGLQERGALTRVHSRVIEVQLRHAKLPKTKRV